MNLSRLKDSRNALLFVALALAWFAISTIVQAVVPAPDGGYPGGNTAEGQSALLSLTTGSFNTAVGFLSLRNDSTGQFNTAIGAGTLLTNTADNNTAIGAGALLSNMTGENNTANGTSTLLHNATGGDNTANGALALTFNTTGGDNTALGFAALEFNSTTSFNTAVGSEALAFNTGDHNTATGYQALSSNTTGTTNTANGAFALLENNNDDNTAIGKDALPSSTGNSNTALGADAGLNTTTGDGNVYIGAQMIGSSNDSNLTYIRNINTTTVSGGGTDTVTVNLSTGLLGHLSSSRRYKEEIKPMDSASETLYQLKPVTYRFKKDIDATQSLDYGLVAEDVAQVDPNLAIRDRKGRLESVRYTAINTMLLNEFLKEHRKVQQLEANAARQQKQIEALTAGLQRVSAQLAAASPSRGGLEVSKPALQAVLNNR